MVLFFKDENMAIIEALLFVATEPLSVKALAQLTNIKENTIEKLLEEMQEEYSKPHKGMAIELVAEGYRVVTKPEYISYVEKLYKPQVNPLSQAALETLAIIAYQNPVTRAEIEAIRGVKADSVVNTLIERGLIEEVGKKDAPGKPIIYGTTNKFLEYLGLKSIGQLPEIDGLFE